MKELSNYLSKYYEVALRGATLVNDEALFVYLPTIDHAIDLRNGLNFTGNYEIIAITATKYEIRVAK